jgi:hypothetical protein
VDDFEARQTYPAAGVDNYAELSDSNKRKLSYIVHNLLANKVDFYGNYASYVPILLEVGYRFALLKDNRGSLVCCLFDSENVGSYLYYWLYGQKHNVYISVPHPTADLNTELVGLYLAQNMTYPPKCVVIAGTHRCNSLTNTSCDGTTQVCTPGVSNPYRISDVVHTVKSNHFIMFQTLFALNNTSVTIEIHGKAASTPIFNMSDGTSLDETGYSLSNLMKAELVAQGFTVECANTVGDPNTLSGSTNSVGRWMNGMQGIFPAANNACDQGSVTNRVDVSNRFLHFECAINFRTSSLDQDKFIVALENLI